MTGRTRTHHEPAPTHQSTHHTTTQEPHTEGASPHRTTSGGGNGVGVHVDAIETMAGRLESTRGRIEGVGSTVRSVNVGPQSMGVIGSGFTGAAEAHVRTAEEHLRRTTEAVEQAQRGTKGTAQAYRDTDAASAASLAAIDSDATPPTPKAPAGGTTPAGTTTTATPPAAPPAPHGGGTASPPGGGGPPPPSSPPPGGGGPPKNTLGHTAATDELAPQYPRHVIDTSPTPTDQQIKDIAAAKGYDPDQHLPKTQTPTASMSHDDRVEVADVRNGIQVTPGEVMTKVVKPELADALLRNQTSWTDADTGRTSRIDPDQLGGSVARGSDTAHYGYPQEFREKLGLDDGGAGWSPVKAGATEAYQLRFPAPDTAHLDPSFGSTNHADAVDMQTIGGSAKLRDWDAPFLGTGYTDGGTTHSGLPEWELTRGAYNDRIEMWRIGDDGKEHLVGVNLPGRGWFDLRRP